MNNEIVELLLVWPRGYSSLSNLITQTLFNSFCHIFNLGGNI